MYAKYALPRATQALLMRAGAAGQWELFVFSLARLAQLCSFLTVFDIGINPSILKINIIPDDIEAQHLQVSFKFDIDS